jgi:glycosyltransferase involved in cell wall biosynthesis
MLTASVKRSDAVSVVIPTYNRNHVLLARALPSVRAQTYPVTEIHVVADGMDNPEYLQLRDRIVDLHDERIKLWWVPHQLYPEDPGQKWMVLGLNARNYGLDQAQGGWIAPLDDDDEWTPDHVKVLLDAVRGADVDFAYGRSEAHWVDGRRTFYGAWPPGHFQFCDGAQLYRNGMGYRYDPRCIERGLPEDGDLWDRMVAGGVRFTFVDQIVHHYYPNPR